MSFLCQNDYSQGAAGGAGQGAKGAVTITTGLAIYFVIWWLVLFAVLPWGVRSQHETGDVVAGSDPGAPTVPHLGRKLLWTTAVAAVVFAVFYVIHANRWITLDDLATLFGLLR